MDFVHQMRVAALKQNVGFGADDEEGSAEREVVQALEIDLLSGGLTIADITGSGHLDLVMAFGDGPVVLIPGNGDGTFQSPAFYTIEPSVSSLSVADVNGDGRPDLIVGSLFGDAPLRILYGSSAPFVRVSVTHTGSLTTSSADVVLTIQVSNATGPAATIGTVTVGIDSSTVTSGAGWDCAGDSCTRAESLAGGTGYLPILTVPFRVIAGVPTILDVDVSGGGSASTSASDAVNSSLQ